MLIDAPSLYFRAYFGIPESAAIGISLASLLVARHGATLAHRVSGLALKRIFAGFLLAMALLLSL